MSASTRDLVPVALNASAAALLAAFSATILHECTHGFAAVICGAHWDSLGLFHASYSWTGALSPAARIFISGGAAIFNIISGLAAIPLLHRASRPWLKLLLMYFAAFSLFAGFGYLMVDPLLYSPSNQVGDWKQIVHILGGGWPVRIVISLIGAAGYLGAMLWISRTVHLFAPAESAPLSPARLHMGLLIIPYLVVNFIITPLAFFHPFGRPAILMTLLQCWCGNIGFFWAFFIATYSIANPTPLADRTRLPTRIHTGVLLAAFLFLTFCIVVLLPTLHF